MQQIVNVTIDSKGNAISDSKSIGLQYETGVTRYAITPDPSWVSDQYFYYIIVSPPEDSDNKQYAVPLVNQGGTFIFEISSGITWHVGNYKFAFLTMNKELVDGQVSKDGIVSISESWNGKITKSILDYIALQKQPADANFQLLYTDLMALSVEVRNQANYAKEQGDYAQKTAEQILQDKENGLFTGKKGDKGDKGDTGDKGDPGQNGLTPYIGENNNWWIGETDTGVSGSGIVLKASKENRLDFNTILDAGMYFIDNATANTVANAPALSIEYVSVIPLLVIDRGFAIVQFCATREGLSKVYSRQLHKDNNGNIIPAAWVALDANFYTKGNVDEKIQEINITINEKEQALQGQIDRLRANQVQGTASGTEIVVQDSAEMESVLRVSGNSEQDSRSGKNLLENIRETTTMSGVTFTVNKDKSITLNGTATADVYFNLNKISANIEDKVKYITLENGNSYTSFLKGGTSGTRLITRSNTVNDALLSVNYGDEFSVKLYNKDTDKEAWTYLGVKNGATFNNVTVYPMILKGSYTLAEPYEPYGVQPSPDYPSEIRSVSGDVELKVEGKNLFSTKLTSDNTRGVTVTINKDRTITLNGTGNSNGTVFISEEMTLQSDIEYTLSSKVLSGTVSNVPSLTSWNDDTSSWAFDAPVGKTQTKKFNKTHKRKIGVYVQTNVVYSNYTIAVQLEEGTIATPYTPYVEPNVVQLPLGDIELRSTPDGTRDTFERVDGVWNKVEKIGYRTLTGNLDNEVWTERSETFNNVKCFQLVSNNYKFSTNGDGLLSNLFNVYKPDTFLNSTEDYEGIATTLASNGYIRLKILKSRLNSLNLEGLSKWLGANALDVACVLVTPTYTPITDQALISALDELEQLILHKGYNYITATSVNGVKAQLDLSYIKDINIVLNNITAMIATIGGEMNV